MYSRCVMLFAVSGTLGCVAGAADPVEVGDSTAQRFKRVAAVRTAAALADAPTRDHLLGALRRTGPVALAEIAALAADDLGDAGGDAVPEVWLHEPTAGGDDANLLVAYAPAGDDRSWTEIPAYTLDGTRVALDARQPPDVPVLVIETHGRLAMLRGIDAANTALQRAGLQRPRVDTVARQATPAAAITGRWTTRLDSIRLADDQEPWISGAAEIYAITSGVIGDNGPELRIVDMPYLDDDGTTYTPHQILIDWTDYTYQAANIQLFEHDDNTSYQDLVTALVTAVGAVGSLAGKPEIQAITEIANRIIAAMPASWFSNDDDYVDTFYTIEKTATYTGYVGAGGNARVSLTPYYLAPN